MKQNERSRFRWGVLSGTEGALLHGKKMRCARWKRGLADAGEKERSGGLPMKRAAATSGGSSQVAAPAPRGEVLS